MSQSKNSKLISDFSKWQDTKSTYRTQPHSFTLMKKHLKNKESHPIHNSIKNNEIFKNFIQGNGKSVE